MKNKNLTCCYSIYLLMIVVTPAWAISNCATLDKNLNISIPCIENNNNFYKASLSYYTHPNDKNNLFWKLAELENSLQNNSCAMASNQLVLDFPCVNYDNTLYSARLDPFINNLDRNTFYWRLGDAQLVNENNAELSCSDLNPIAGEIKTIAQASIFPGIVDDGSQLVISYASGNELFVHPHDYQLTATASPVQLTTSANVTDHKHIFFKNAHYLLYSTLGDSDLFLLKLDRNFQPILTVTVSQNSENTKTNDMLLGNDGSYIVTGQFRPGNLNNFENTGHLIKRYNTDLNLIEPEIVANELDHVNTAAIIYIENKTHFIAPSTPITDKQVATQRDLLLFRYDSEWNILDNQAITLVDSHRLVHHNDGDGIWMSTGIAHSSDYQCLLVGHTFVDAKAGSDTGKIYLRLVNDDSFMESSSQLISESKHSNRAHFLLKDESLYVVFDDSASGSPAIKGVIYQLK